MFDIGFVELLLVAIIALLVMGPERLPEAMRTVGLWWGRFMRSFHSIRAEIEREVGMDEVRRQIYNESILADLERARREVSEVGEEARETIESARRAAIEQQRATSAPAKPPADESQVP